LATNIAKNMWSIKLTWNSWYFWRTSCPNNCNQHLYNGSINRYHFNNNIAIITGAITGKIISLTGKHNVPYTDSAEFNIETN